MAVKWLDKPEDHDFDAAAEYLSMVADAETVRATVKALRHAEPLLRKAKDILRAAELTLLSADNPHVRSDLAKIAGSAKLSLWNGLVPALFGDLRRVRRTQRVSPGCDGDDADLGIESGCALRILPDSHRDGPGADLLLAVSRETKRLGSLSRRSRFEPRWRLIVVPRNVSPCESQQ